MVNSAAFGASRARAIAIAFGLRQLTDESGLPKRLSKQIWISNLRKASSARLAVRCFSPRHADSAFCVGLIQDIGLPVLMAVDPNFYNLSLVPGDERGTWSQQESARFGIDHASVGYRLLNKWGAPPHLVETVLHHHNPPLDLTADDLQLKLPGFLASLLPHLAEEPTPGELEWMIALHAQLLDHEFPTPAAFTDAAAAEAATLHDTTTDRDLQHDAPIMMKLIQAVTGDTLTMVGQLCQFENALVRQREHLSSLRFEAFTDPLTGVLNRRGFHRLAERRLEEAVKHRLGVCALALDLDGFKSINDTYGHEAGDTVLTGVAALLRDHLDRSDLIGRLGSDEFAILFTALDKAMAKQIAHRVTQAANSAKVTLGLHADAAVSLSVGATHCPSPGVELTIDDLLAAADEAMCQRKRNGKGGMEFKTDGPA